MTEQNGLYTIRAGSEHFKTRDLSAVTWADLERIERAAIRASRLLRRDRILA